MALQRILAQMSTSGRVRLSHKQLGAAIGRCARQVHTIVHRLALEVGLRIERSIGYANTYCLELVSEPLEPASFATDSSAAGTSNRPAFNFMRRITREGGCIHGDVACADCLEHHKAS
jgi:hypothetical protein